MLTTRREPARNGTLPTRWECEDRTSHLFSPELVGRGYHVTVNGMRVEDCVAGDVDEGWVEVYLRDGRGAHVLDRARTAIARRRLHGDVVLHPPT